MLKDIKQTDYRLLKVIQKYGCYFLSLAESSPLIFEGEAGIKALNFIWCEATSKGYISDDLNKDGDFDDAGEAEIANVEALARTYFALDVKYDNKHHDADEVIPENVKVVLGMYFWKGSHFVLLNREKEVIFDSFGYSNTVMNGVLKSMRWLYAV